MSSAVGRRGPDFLIVGSPRSGTTLVQRLAGEIPGVAMPTETHFFDIFVRRLLERGPPPFGASRLAQEIDEWRQMVQVRGVEVDPSSIIAALGGRCDSLLDLFDAIVRQVAPEGTLYGEKTPNHLYWWRPIVRALPTVRMIAIVRDPRAVVASTLGAPWLSEVVHPRWGTDSYVAVAERWRAEQQLVQTMSKSLGARCLVLRYEDVVTDPTRARDAIGRLLGVTTSAPLTGAARPVVAQPWETWKVDALTDVRTDRTSAWSDELGPRRSLVVKSVCGRPMRAFGYRTSSAERVVAAVAGATLNPLTQWRRRALRKGQRINLAWIDGVEL